MKDAGTQMFLYQLAKHNGSMEEPKELGGLALIKKALRFLISGGQSRRSKKVS